MPALKRNSATFEWTLQRTNFQYLMAVGEWYRLEGGKWNRGADFLFRCLIYALDLKDQQEFIVYAVKPKRGRKSNTDLARGIWEEKAQGKTAREIASALKAAGKSLSIEGVESYLKTRRKHR
jgi:hypothetical protein